MYSALEKKVIIGTICGRTTQQETTNPKSVACICIQPCLLLVYVMQPFVFRSNINSTAFLCVIYSRYKCGCSIVSENWPQHHEDRETRQTRQG